MTKRITRRRALKIGASAGAGLGMSLVLRRAYPYIRQPIIPLEKSAVPVQPFFAQSPTNIPKFSVTLPGLTPAGANSESEYIPVATKTSMVIAGVMTDVYTLGAAEFPQELVPGLGEATLWGYYDKSTATGADNSKKYLGGAIVATRGTPVLLQITNELPTTPVIPVDPTIMASATETVGQLPMNRIATHLHGGFTPWFSDGTPFQWYTPATPGMTGPSFMNVPAVPGLAAPPAGTATYYYPMDQSARFVWYHDHAIGITRTNVYSGLASAFVITDDFEKGLLAGNLLPTVVGGSIGVPLVIQDKTFVGPDTLTEDPGWPEAGGNIAPGSLWYPHVYEPLADIDPATGGCVPIEAGRWDYGLCPASGGPATLANPTLPPTSAVAEAFFDTILVNGAPYPTVTVPPQRVRFRILNASQARFFHLNLYPEGSTAGEAAVTLGDAPGSESLPPGTYLAGPVYVTASTPGPKMYQVGSEGGFLPAVVVHDNTTPIAADLVADDTGGTVKADGPFNLLLAPAERADVIIDFNGVTAGQSFILYNDAPAPFPGGDPRNDYYTDNPDQSASGLNVGGAPTTQPGFGPNTRTLLRIEVNGSGGDSTPTDSWLGQLNPLLAANFGSRGQQPPPLYPGTFLPGSFVPFTGTPNRVLTLNEDFDDFGRLIQTLGTDVPDLTINQGLNNQGITTWGRPYVADPTETPKAGAVEVWQILNTTADTHPMHFHLVNVQVLQRQAIVAGGDPSNFTLDVAMPPDDNERGWKETVRMNSGEATTIMMQFTLPTLPAAMGNPTSSRFPTIPTGAHEYVWHCHILEHEEHDMMRPLVVIE